MDDALQARIGEMHVTTSQVIMALGLGSCVGVCIYDEAWNAYGVAHVLLAEAPEGSSSAQPAKFANRAVPELVSRVTATGGVRGRLRAVICGGSAMFGDRPGPNGQIGERNVAAVREALAAEGIPVKSEHVGGTTGRTMWVMPGQAWVRVIGQPAVALA